MKKRFFGFWIAVGLITLTVGMASCELGIDKTDPETAETGTAEPSVPVTEAHTEEASTVGDESEAIECTHVYGEWESLAEASCTKRGVNIRLCTLCSHQDLEVIPATGHTEVTDPGKEALCTAVGYTEGKHCSVCGEVTLKQTVIPATGHTEELLSRVEPTCTAHGLAEGVACSLCGEILSGREDLAPTGHTEVIDPRVEPTCTESGLSEGRHCGVCGFVLYSQVVRPATGHTETALARVEPTCTAHGLAEGVACSLCGEILSGREDLAPTGHTEVIDPRVEPTCTESGLSEGRHCGVCGFVLYSQVVRPATGHTETALARVEPTCSEPGLTEGVGCSACGTVMSGREPIAALGHIVVTDPRVEPTCTEDGLSEGKHCRVCGKIVIAQRVLSALGHEEEIIPTVPATCTEGGMTAGICCGRCGAVSVEPVPTEPLGHNYDGFGVCIRCDRTNASDGLAFMSNGDGTCTLIGMGSCTDTHVVIPSVSPEGDTVTALSYDLYLGNGLQSVTIPNTVVAVGGFFGGVKSSVEICFLGTRAELHAVTHMYDLMSTEYHYVTCADGEVFVYGGAIEDPRFVFTSNGDGTCCVSGIGTAAIGVIPLYSPEGERVVAVGEAALKGQYLEILAIPTGVTRIEDEAFRETEFWQVYVADTVTFIGDYAFAYTNTMGMANQICEAVSRLSGLTHLGKGALGTKGTSERLTLTLPEGVTSVPDCLFAGGMWTDVHLILHRNVTYLGACLFDGWNTHARIDFEGTVAEWNAMEKHVDWNSQMYPITITCIDGEIITEDLNTRLD